VLDQLCVAPSLCVGRRGKSGPCQLSKSARRIDFAWSRVCARQRGVIDARAYAAAAISVLGSVHTCTLPRRRVFESAQRTRRGILGAAYLARHTRRARLRCRGGANMVGAASRRLVEVVSRARASRQDNKSSRVESGLHRVCVGQMANQVAFVLAQQVGNAIRFWTAASAARHTLRGLLGAHAPPLTAARPQS
jgi:hypothetical protein